MREILASLVAFVREHQRCGELDGGRDNGYVWLACSCGAQITHPAHSTGEEPDIAAPEPKARWLVVCSCGWERETVSEWAARSVSKLHPQLAPMDVAHVTRVEGPDNGAVGQQLTLT